MLLAVVLLLAIGACAPPDGPKVATADTAAAAGTADAGGTSSTTDQGAVIAAHRALLDAFRRGDVDAAAALMDPTSQLLVFHPYIENRFDGAEQVREGLARMFAHVRGMEWTDVDPTIRIEGDVAWLSSQVLVQSDQLDAPFVGRGTEVWVRRGDNQWRLAHGHWSEHARIATGARETAAK